MPGWAGLSRRGVLRADGIVPLRHVLVHEDGSVRVELEIAGGVRYDVVVRPRRLIGIGAFSCDGSGGATTTYDLVSLTRSRARSTMR